MASLVKVVDRDYLIRQFQNYDTNVVAPQIQNLEDKKVDKVAGYGLSKNDFTDAFKAKLESLQNYDDSALSGRVGDVETTLATLQGDSTTEGSIAKMTADAVASIVADAPESFDTLKEISDWIGSHSDSAATMNTAINGNTSKIAEHDTKLQQLEAQLGGLDLSIENVDINFNDLYGDGNSDITLSSNKTSIVVGETATIASDVSGVSLSVNDPSVATIENDVVTGVAPGTVTVRATKYGYTDGTVNITVNPKPTVQITGSAEVYVGETITLTSNAPNTVWESSDENIATVENGVVTGVFEGEAIITASAAGYNNGTKAIVVSVKPSPTTLTEEETKEAITTSIENTGTWVNKGTITAKEGSENSYNYEIAAATLAADEKAIINDLARFFGRLHDEGINEIVYNDTAYDWNDELTLKGSRFANGETTLVAAISGDTKDGLAATGKTTITVTVNGVVVEFDVSVV